MNKKYNITKDFLIKEYIINKRTIHNIAKEIDCSDWVIQNGLLKFKIRNTFDSNYNSKLSKILTKKFLIKEYIKNRKSSRQIAKKVECSYRNILYHLKKYKIKIRQKLGKDNGKFVDGRCSKVYFCKEKECNNIITWQNATKGQGRCGSCAKKGKLNINWQGYITPINPFIRSMIENKKWRIQVFERDNYTCQDCGDNKGGNLEAHHKIHFSELLKEFLKEYDQFSPIEDKETLIRLAIKWKPFWNIDNGKTLCKKCHIKIHIILNKETKNKEKILCQV